MDLKSARAVELLLVRGNLASPPSSLSSFSFYLCPSSFYFYLTFCLLCLFFFIIFVALTPSVGANWVDLCPL